MNIYLRLYEYISYFTITAVGLWLVYKAGRKYRVGASTGFLTGMVVYYGVVPLLLLFNENAMATSRIKLFFFSAGTWSKVLAIFCILLGLFCFRFGSRLKPHKAASPDTGAGNDNSIVENRVFEKIALATFLVGCGFFIIFIYGCGGIKRMLSLAEISRSHTDSIRNYGVRAIYTYFALPSALIPFSNLMYLAKLCIAKKKNYKRTVFMFMLTLVFSYIYFLYNAGRSPMLLHMVILLYAFLHGRVKHPWIIIFGSAIIGMPLLDYLDSLFIYFSTGVWLKVKVDYLSYIYQFSNPSILVRNMSQIVDRYGFMFFKFCVTDILSLLPLVSFTMSYSYGSEYLRGTNWRALGGVPTDVITYGYLQLGFVGVILQMLVLGILFAWIDDMINCISNPKLRSLIGVIMATSVFNVAASTDLYVILQRNYNFVFLFIALFIINKVKRKRSYQFRAKPILQKMM